MSETIIILSHDTDVPDIITQSCEMTFSHFPLQFM